MVAYPGRVATGASSAPLVSVIVITNRDAALLQPALSSVAAQAYRPVELVVLGNGVELAAHRRLQTDDVPLRLMSTEVDVGVAEGRNAAARVAAGDLLLFLDDDATLAPGAIEAAVRAVRSSSRVGAVSFRVLDPETHRPALWYFPFDPARWASSRFDAPVVVGCGHLIRRRAFEALSGFWEGYQREREEIDLSWRLLDSGWLIRYEPEAVVEHPERTRLHMRHQVASHVWMVWRLLPAPLALRQTVVLLALFGARSLRRGVPIEFMGGVVAAAVGWRRAWRSRAVLRPRTVAYLRRMHAPLGPAGRLQWDIRAPRVTPSLEGRCLDGPSG
jgi:GT2 family glycosyltransferase